jgi:PIN domain nuclease of toxin-antitoxin system
MNFSLDTNIVIGLVNSKDRLHNTSINLMKEKENDLLFICEGVLLESQTLLRNKINEIMTQIIQYLPDFLEITKLGSVNLHSLILEIIKKIRDAKPGLENFLDLVHNQILLFLDDHPIDKLPSFLSELSMRYTKPSIQKKIEEIHSIFKILSLNQKALHDIKKSLAEIYFKDTNDERIFLEIISNLNEINPIELYSNDNEFRKKCEMGYENIKNDLKFDNQAFQFILRS